MGGSSGAAPAVPHAGSREGGAAAIAAPARSRLPPAEAGSAAGMAAAAARGRVLCLFDVDGTLTPARQVARHGGHGVLRGEGAEVR